ncbi:50S ribosomal protein L30 [Candidatus Bathyarchaeota archaeon]|nr:MAG: 50S ribosomal protein L30 [Candidatus Bathyarchaeota archaeon]
MPGQEEKGSRLLAVIRIRGTVNVPEPARYTMALLGLHRNCHATLIDDRPSYLGMLRKAQVWLTWGEVDLETLTELLRRRGTLKGGKPITDDYARRLGFESLEDLAKAIYELKVDFRSLPDVKPVFRLHPPSGGYRGKVKRSFREGGAWGYRGTAINDLLKRMM